MVEMVTSCAILALLMLALGYGLKLALVSTGAGAARAVATRDATDVVERVTDDLNEAINFTEKGPEAVTFTVPNRGPDLPPGSPPRPPDEIRYQWWPAGGTLPQDDGGLIGGLLGLLGTSADPLTVPPHVVTRQVNGGPVSVLARDVRHFKLDYLYRTSSPPAAPAADRILWQHDPLLAEGTAVEAAVTATAWTGETFRATVPSGTTSYTITRVALFLRSDAALDGLLRVRVFSADPATNKPYSNLLIDESLVPEVSLAGSVGWVNVPFTKLTNLDPLLKYSIVVTGDGVAANHGAVLYYQYLLAPLLTPLPANTYWVQSADGGATWGTPQTLRSLRYRVYGTTRN
jgi:hypothetical protein